MPAPNTPDGTQSRRNRERTPQKNGDIKDIPDNKEKDDDASGPGSDGQGRKDKGLGYFDLPALNPPFDPRMRRVGSPLNLTRRVKRGWIQSAGDDGHRVNFLFNPSALELGHQIDPEFAKSPEQAEKTGDQATTIAYPTIGSNTSVKLLYDRTYELFSAPKSGTLGFANTFGVWADVAAWYVYLGMLPLMPTSWDDSLILNPPHYKLSYLFIGPRMVFYGWVTGINVVYSHFTQDMIPSRCAVSADFQLMPHTGESPFRGQSPPIDLLGNGGTWLDDWVSGGSPPPRRPGPGGGFGDL